MGSLKVIHLENWLDSNLKTEIMAILGIYIKYLSLCYLVNVHFHLVYMAHKAVHGDC